MIPANELRIGNWVGNGDKNFQVEHFMLSPDIGSADGYKYDVDYLQIPLTPEILEKCGFENQSGNTTYQWWWLDIGGFTKTGLVVCRLWSL